MRRTPILGFFLCATVALAAPRAAGPVLPHAFDGWTAGAPKDMAPAPGSADAAVLKEYGLVDVKSASYQKGSNTLTIRVWRFGDATGAFGTFTFLRQPGMQAENVGAGGAVSGDRHLFWSSAVVVDATFAHPATNETAVLTSLAADLPKAAGTQGV